MTVPFLTAYREACCELGVAPLAEPQLAVLVIAVLWGRITDVDDLWLPSDDLEPLGAGTADVHNPNRQSTPVHAETTPRVRVTGP